MREISLSLTASEMNDFFSKLRLHLRDIRKDTRGSRIEPHPLGPKGIALTSKLAATQTHVSRALTQRFDAQEALRELQCLMRYANQYMLSQEPKSINLLESVGRYIAGVFGFTPTVCISFREERVAPFDAGCKAKAPSREETVAPVYVACEAKAPPREEIIAPVDVAREAEDSSSEESLAPLDVASETREQSVAPVLDVFVAFRDEIRAVARNGGENTSRKLLNICERIRDDSLPPLGIRLEEVFSERGAQTRWKLENAESILKDIERRKDDEKRWREKMGILEEKRIRRESNDLMSGGNTVEHLFNGDDSPAYPPLVAKEPADDMLD